MPYLKKRIGGKKFMEHIAKIQHMYYWSLPRTKQNNGIEQILKASTQNNFQK
jgi:hypothetical protein